MVVIMSSGSPFRPKWEKFDQLTVRYDDEQSALWYYLVPEGRPCFNLVMLGELRRFQHQIEQITQSYEIEGKPGPFRYTVLASSFPGVFNLGGDLKLFAGLIRNHDRDGLFRYAKACIDVLYPNAVNFELPITTVSLVQGDALGGGFEAAISSNLVVAEKSAQFGLPEILFNLIPGMGAYSFLIRRVSPDVAQELILGGDTLTAQEMFDLKLIDAICEDGEGEQAVKDVIKAHQRRGNAHAAMQRVRQCVNPVTYKELIQVTRIWVDTALQLTDRDIRMIEHLIRAQDARCLEARKEPQAKAGYG